MWNATDKQFEEAESESGKIANGRKRSSTVRIKEVLGAAREAITRTPRKIVGRLAQQIEVSTSTVREICRETLSLCPYNMQLRRSLSQEGMARRYASAREYGELQSVCLECHVVL